VHSTQEEEEDQLRDVCRRVMEFRVVRHRRRQEKRTSRVGRRIVVEEVRLRQEDNILAEDLLEEEDRVPVFGVFRSLLLLRRRRARRETRLRTDEDDWGDRQLADLT